MPPPSSLLILLLLPLLRVSPHSLPRSRRSLLLSFPPPSPPPHRHHHSPHLPPPPIPQPSPPPFSIPPTPPPSSTPKFPSSSASSNSNPYPFTNYPFFPTFVPPPPPPAAPEASSGDGGLPTFPANISTLVAPTPPAGGGARRFPVLQALLLSFLSLCLLLLSALLSLHLFRRLRRGGPASASRGGGSRADDDEGRRLKPPPMPTSSSNPSTEFLYLGTLAAPPSASAAPPPAPEMARLRPGSPELRPLPPLPRVGPPSGEFGSRSSASDPSTVPHAAAAASSSSLSPSSPSVSSPTLCSSPAQPRPPSIPQPRGRAPNPSPPKRRPQPPPPRADQERGMANAWNPFVVAMPPQTAPSDEEDAEKDMRKSRPLHSDKLKPGSLQMREEMIQLYLNNSAAATVPREVCLLGAPRCHGIGVLVGALGVSKEQVRDALLEGNAHGLGVEALQMLMKMFLTNEEELKLKGFKDDSPSRLCPVETFMKTVLDVPFAFKRVEAMLYIANFYLEVNQLRMSFAALEAACQELRTSRLFHKVLEAVLHFGNLMSTDTGTTNVHALEPNTLLKIVDVKGADGKAALLQFIVQEIVKPEGYNVMYSGSTTCKTNANTLQYDVECRKHGLQVISKLTAELNNCKKAASMDIMELSRNVSELAVGLGKIHDVLRLNSMLASAESARRFHNAMSMFLRQAEEEILKLQAQESICLSSVNEVTEYLHGESAKEEAQAFRIFMGVKEFLTILDRICKEAGEMNNNCIGTATVNWMAVPMEMTP